MLRSSLLAVSAAILCTAASGQQQVQAKKVLGPVRDAGIYHVATGTWTRTGGQTNISPDCIYRNDANSGYFGTGWDNCKGVDEIMLPGTSNLKYPTSFDSYLVDGMSFSWCKNGAGTVDWTFEFYDSFVPCDDVDSPANCINSLGVTYTFTGLPGGSACWILTVDLAGGYELCFETDGGVCAPDYQGGGLGLDHAGVSHQWLAADGLTTGPILQGNPTWDTPGGYTCYNNVGMCGATVEATGLGTQDLFTITGAAPCAVGPGCFFFGGYTNTNGCDLPSQTPLGSFNLCLFADCNTDCDSTDCFTTYCDTNPNNVAVTTLDNCDLNTTSVVTLAGAAPGQFSYLLIGMGSGTLTDPQGGLGDLCLIGSAIGRYNKPGDVAVTSSTGGRVQDIKDSNTGGANFGLPNPPGGSIMPGQTWNFQYWYRDGMNPARFSNAITATFN